MRCTAKRWYGSIEEVNEENEGQVGPRGEPENVQGWQQFCLELTQIMVGVLQIKIQNIVAKFKVIK